MRAPAFALLLIVGCSDLPVEPVLDFDRDEVTDRGVYLVGAQIVGGVRGVDYSGWTMDAEQSDDGEAWRAAPFALGQTLADGSATGLLRIDGWLRAGDVRELRIVASDDNGNDYAGASVLVRVREW